MKMAALRRPGNHTPTAILAVGVISPHRAVKGELHPRFCSLSEGTTKVNQAHARGMDESSAAMT